MPNVKKIVDAVTDAFNTFGGGRVDPTNPISIATKDRPAMFAAGVDVENVVRFVLKSAKPKKHIKK